MCYSITFNFLLEVWVFSNIIINGKNGILFLSINTFTDFSALNPDGYIIHIFKELIVFLRF